MTDLTLDLEELRKRWMKLYLNFMMLNSKIPKAKKILENFQPKAAEFNGEVMDFLDALSK